MSNGIPVNKYRKETRRCKNYDYGSNGIYFVTINTLGHKPYLGQLVTTDDCPSLLPTEMGSVVKAYWKQIPKHYPFVKLDAFVIMPDHMHGILIFDDPEKKIFAPNHFGPQSRNLGAVIRGFKASVKRYANNNLINFEWQPRYHDTILYTDESLINCRNYIYKNMDRALSSSRSAPGTKSFGS